MTTPLGPELGRLGAPPRGAPFDDVRLSLLDALFAAHASGEQPHAAWEEAFAAAVRSLRVRVLASAEQALRAAAVHSRYSQRRLNALLPNADSADALMHRMLAAGMPLESLATASIDDGGVRARAAALETSWFEAERLAIAETVRWRGVAERVAAWRRPSLPIWIASGALVLVALIAAAWLSGDVSAPAWFAPVNAFWWKLWP